MNKLDPVCLAIRRVAYENLTKKQSRVLVIGDLHEPFCLDGYLDHCQRNICKT